MYILIIQLYIIMSTILNWYANKIYDSIAMANIWSF